MSELKSSGKPFEISKREVWDAYLKVRENQGAAGVDGCTVEEFEKDLQGNLYKIWNLHFSRFHFPEPSGVRQEWGGVHILPSGGQQECLEEDGHGSPLVADSHACHLLLRGVCEMIEPHHSRMDAVLRGVLSNRTVSPPAAHQLLPVALGPEEAQTTEDLQEGHEEMGSGRSGLPLILRALEMGQRHLAKRAIGAR